MEKDGALEIDFKFMRACHEMNSIVHTSVGHTPSINGKSEPQIKSGKYYKIASNELHTQERTLVLVLSICNMDTTKKRE